MEAAYEAAIVLSLAEDSPATLDPPPGTPGARSDSWAPEGELPGVSEFFPAELAVVLNCGRGTAAHLARRAWTWRERLPLTFAALAAGEIDERRARELADVLGDVRPAVAKAVEARLLPEATSLSLRALRARAIELALQLDAGFAEERRTLARRAANVCTYPSGHQDGMATLAADLTVQDAAACFDVLDQLARQLKAEGDGRPVGQLRTLVLVDLVTRPWLAGAGVAARINVTAPLASLRGEGTRPGGVDGLPVTAGHLRELLTRVDALGLRSPEGGSLTFALTDEAGRLLATLTPAELTRLARRAGPGLGPPPATDAYEPTEAQRVFVRIRDRTCRFPNCGQRVGWSDLDHVIAHSCGGETDCANLCCLCRSHHRLKTFATGWTFTMDPDGTLHVTTPSGITRSTRPPGLRHPDAPAEDPPPPPPPDPPPF
jgi:hypothetical protein